MAFVIAEENLRFNSNMIFILFNLQYLKVQLWILTQHFNKPISSHGCLLVGNIVPASQLQGVYSSQLQDTEKEEGRPRCCNLDNVRP